MLTSLGYEKIIQEWIFLSDKTLDITSHKKEVDLLLAPYQKDTKQPPFSLLEGLKYGCFND